MATECEYITAPREICQTCANPSGPIFTLGKFQHPSESALHRTQQALTGGLQRSSKLAEIEEVELELHRLDEEVERLEATLTALRARRDELKTHAYNERCLLSPIRNLSYEIMGHILPMTIHPHALSSKVLIVEQVCAHWRAVAQSTPELWSTIVVDAEWEEDVWEAIAVIEKYVKLSGDVPMTFRFKSNLPSRERCIQALARCAHRWDVVVNINMDVFRDVVALMPEGSSLDWLTHISIRRIEESLVVPAAPRLNECAVGMRNKHSAEARISFQSIPALTTLRLGRLKNSSDVLSGIPWEKLTHFKSNNLTVYGSDELSNMLQKMTSLTSLIVTGDTSITSPIVLPQVRSFSMKDAKTASNAHEIFIFPNLTTLTPGDKLLPENLIQLLHRSGCKLECIHISSDLTEHWRAQELQHIRHLVHYPHRDYISGLKSLNRTPSTNTDVGGPEILPNLEILEIAELTVSEYSGSAALKELISIVQSRLRGASAFCGEAEPDNTSIYLKQVTLKFGYSSFDKHVQSWNEFCQSEIAQAAGVVWNTTYRGVLYTY